jgi:hypothetical protein
MMTFMTLYYTFWHSDEFFYVDEHGNSCLERFTFADYATVVGFDGKDKKLMDKLFHECHPRKCANDPDHHDMIRFDAFCHCMISHLSLISATVRFLFSFDGRNQNRRTRCKR